jgi:hypothetical protein
MSRTRSTLNSGRRLLGDFDVITGPPALPAVLQKPAEPAPPDGGQPTDLASATPDSVGAEG